MDEPQWQITIRVPARLPHDQLDALFTAVADAVHDWEPGNRDGWDADVSACTVDESDTIAVGDPPCSVLFDSDGRCICEMHQRWRWEAKP